MSTTHTLHQAANTTFRSGIVCFANEEYSEIIVLYNSETNKTCLPQAPCQWLPGLPAQSSGLLNFPTVESFDVTAERLACSTLDRPCKLWRYQGNGLICQPSSFGFPSKRDVFATPFVMDTTADGYAMRITAWFLAVAREFKDNHDEGYYATYEKRAPLVDTAFSRGEEWTFETILTEKAESRLAMEEAMIVERASLLMTLDSTHEYRY